MVVAVCFFVFAEAGDPGGISIKSNHFGAEEYEIHLRPHFWEGLRSIFSAPYSADRILTLEKFEAVVDACKIVCDTDNREKGDTYVHAVFLQCVTECRKMHGITF